MKIAYRAVNILLAVLIVLSAFFVNFIEVKMETTESLAELFKTFSKDASEGAAVYEQFSVKRMIDVARGKDSLSSIFSSMDGPILWPEDFNVLNARLITVGVSLVFMVALALFIIIFSIFSGNKLVPFITGIVGIIADIVMIAAFRSAATDVYNGTVDLSAFLLDKIVGSNLFSSLLGSLAGNAVNFVFSLCGLQNALLFIFIAVVLWAAINFLVNLGDPEAEKEKQASREIKAAKKSAKKAKKEGA